MKNLICIFFGHKDDQFTFTGDFRLRMNYTMHDGKDYPIADFKKCERCGDIFLHSLPMSKIEWKKLVESA